MPQPAEKTIKALLLVIMLAIVAITFIYCYYTQEPSHDGEEQEALPTRNMRII